MASSLEILRPTTSLRTPSSRPTPQTTTTTDLERHSIAISQALALNNTTHPILKTHLSPDFTSDDRQTRSAAASRIGTEVISVCANVDEERGRASVWLLSREKDLRSGGLSGENVTVLSWWKERGMWRCYRQIAERGISGFPPSFWR